MRQSNKRFLPCQRSTLKLKASDTEMEKFITGNFDKIPMKGEGLPMQEDALVDVFWDKDSKEVLLSVKFPKIKPKNIYWTLSLI